MTARPIAVEVASVFAGVCAATWLVAVAPPPIAPYGQVLLAAVFLVTALRMARRRAGGVESYGLALGGLLAPPVDADDAGSLRELSRTLRRGLPDAARELGWALGLALIVFPAYGALYALWHDAPGPFRLAFPPNMVDFALGQLVVVALPEEALFRGYFQTRLGDLWPRETRLLGAPLRVPAWLLQAALFGVVHVFSGGAPRLTTALPGLLFGWLRARRGGIGAAVFFHALSNLCAELLHRGLW